MRKLKVGIIGCGYWGRNVIKTFYESDRCQLIAVCDTKKENLQSTLTSYPCLRGFYSYEEMLEKAKEIDALAIVVNTDLHFEFAKRALEAGIHVYVEKPLAKTSDEARELTEIANRKNLILLVGHVFCYNPAIRKLKEVIHKGEIGEIRFINSTRTSLGPRVRSDVNILWDYAIHDLYLFPFILGEKPIKVNAIGKSHLQKNEGIEDWVSLSIDFQNGCATHSFVSWYYPCKIRNMIVVGSRKMIEYDDLASNKLVLHDKGYAPIKGFDSLGNKDLELYDRGSSCINVESAPALREEVDHFLRCILRKGKPLTSGEEAQITLKLIEAMQVSLKNNKEVKVI